MSEQCRNLLSGPVTLSFPFFFFFFPLWKHAENWFRASRNKLSEGPDSTCPHTASGSHIYGESTFWTILKRFISNTAALYWKVYCKQRFLLFFWIVWSAIFMLNAKGTKNSASYPQSMLEKWQKMRMVQVRAGLHQTYWNISKLIIVCKLTPASMQTCLIQNSAGSAKRWLSHPQVNGASQNPTL